MRQSTRSIMSCILEPLSFFPVSGPSSQTSQAGKKKSGDRIDNFQYTWMNLARCLTLQKKNIVEKALGERSLGRPPDWSCLNGTDFGVRLIVPRLLRLAVIRFWRKIHGQLCRGKRAADVTCIVYTGCSFNAPNYGAMRRSLDSP